MKTLTALLGQKGGQGAFHPDAVRSNLQLWDERRLIPAETI